MDAPKNAPKANPKNGDQVGDEIVLKAVHSSMPVTNEMLSVFAICRGLTPLLMNRVSEETLLNIRNKVKAPKGAPRQEPRAEAAGKLHADAEGKPYVPSDMLYSALVAAGVYIRLDQKRQISTSKGTTLPSFLTLLDPVMYLDTPGWEVDLRQGRNPNGGELAVICRPRFDVWHFKVNFLIDTREIGEDKIRELFDLAGRRCGLGDFRPNRRGIYGQFLVENWTRQPALVAMK